MLLLNARSVAAKLDELCLVALNLKPDIIFVTETWLNERFDDDSLHVPRYNLFRCDRQDRRGGGVCLWISEKLPSSYIPILSCPSSIECLLLEVRTKNRRINICSVYIPPSLLKSTHDQVTTFLTDLVDERLSVDPDCGFIIAGDFNDFRSEFLREQFNFVNKVKTATRGASFLDQIWIDEDLLESYNDDASIGAPLKGSDHSSVVLYPTCNATLSSEKLRYIKVWDYRASNLAEYMRKVNSADFHFDDDRAPIDELVDTFYSVLNTCISVVPYSMVLFSKRDKPWITPLLKSLIDKRWIAFRCGNWQDFHHYKRKVTIEILKAKRIWAERQKRSSRGLWNVVNDARGRLFTDPISPLLEHYPSTISFVHALTETFCHNFSWETDEPLLPLDNVGWDFSVTPFQVFQKLRRLNLRKSVGSDRIPMKLLTIAADILCYPLSVIFNRSIQSKSFPTSFKFAFISPIPKKRCPTVRDFRPISVLPAISKVFEQLVLDNMKAELLKCYSPHQHAYRPLGSTTSALVSIMDKVTLALDKSNTAAVRIVCLDLSKAFDGLQIPRLVNYLNSRDLNHGFLSWLVSYLTSRYFVVRVHDTSGAVIRIPSGVPQGSVLGPYLFAAFMGSITFEDTKQIEAIQYADDVTLIETIQKNSPVRIDFSGVDSKFREVGLTLNRQKCKEMVIYRSANFSLPADSDLSRVDSLRILGVTLTSNLSWSTHMSDIFVRASRRLYVIRCLRSIITREELILVYHAMVTSLFLYASPVFGNLPRSFSVRIDNFQRRAHKLICNPSCRCDSFPGISERFVASGLNFLRSCHQNSIHPLHHSVPANLPYSGLYRLDHCATSRRLNSFFPFYCMKANELCLS